MPIWGRPEVKPPPATPIDRFAGIVQGMQGFYALSESAGPNVVDAIGNINLAASGWGTTNPWSQGAVGGPGLLCTTASAGFDGTLPPALQIGYPVSCAVGLVPTGIPASTADYWTAYAFSSSSNRVVFGLRCSSNKYYLSYVSGTTAYSITGSVGPTAGSPSVLAATIGPTSQAIYLNGLSIGTASQSVSSAAYNATTNGLRIGANSTLSTAPAALVLWAAWWNRLLAAGEIAAVSASVNAIWPLAYGPPRPYWLYRHAAAASGGFPLVPKYVNVPVPSYWN